MKKNGSHLTEFDRVLADETATASALVGLWESRETARWHADLRRVRLFVQRALGMGEFLLVCDATWEVLGREGTDFELRLARADALRRVGSRPEALETIEALALAPGLSPERRAQLQALAADLLWEAALEEEHPASMDAGWKSALNAYQKLGEIRPDDPLPTIRQAALESLLHRFSDARRSAKRALDLCQRRRKRAGSDVREIGYQAVAWLILGQADRARDGVLLAARKNPRAFQEHALLRHRLRMIGPALGRKASELDEFFPPLNLIVFAGHKLDEPKRKSARFPKEDEKEIEALIRVRLEKLKALIGVASGACGADILFHEAMLARGGTVHLVLPWTRDRFLKNSVEPHENAVGWIPRFERIWSEAASHRVIGEFEPTSEDIGLSYAREVMAGRARLIARSMHLDLIPLALWDGVVDSPGGTGGFIRFWRERGVRPDFIDLRRGSRASGCDDLDAVPVIPVTAASPLAAPPLRQQVKAMLFADIVGYSRLPEQSIPAFVHLFLGGVSRLASACRLPPLCVNTWGDAIYLVFDTAEGAGEFALDLIGFVLNGDWTRHGLEWEDPKTQKKVPLNMRVGLHAGPVFAHFDPVVRHLGFTGAHVSRAARIEPIADEGKVFASEEFAALAAVEQARGFACDFVGTRKLPKKYPGDFLLYRLRRITRLPWDDLARAIHARYCRDAEKKGETVGSKPALRQWEDLPPDYQTANQQAAAAIPELLKSVGLILEPSPPGWDEEFVFSEPELLALAKLEHERWSRAKREAGFRYAAKDNEDLKLRAWLVPWARLPAEARARTFDQVREIPRLAALARHRIRRVG